MLATSFGRRGVGERGEVARHYAAGGLTGRIAAALAAAGLDGANVGVEALAPLDQFHTRGLAATVELAEAAGIGAGEVVLDVGSGLGGPSRFLAATRGCTVTGVDLSPEFVAAAGFLAGQTGLEGRVSYQVGDALALPFGDGAFDVAWTQHVAMNIRERDRLYAEVHRVLRPGGRFAVYDVVAGGGEVIFPVPWSRGPGTSFLLSAEEMRESLVRAGFGVRSWVDRTAGSVAWFREQAAARARAARQPAALGLHLAMGPDFPAMAANLERNLAEGRVGIVEAVLVRD